MNNRKPMNRKQLSEEMLRVKGENEEEIVINRERYLSLLHELKVLRFKICRKKYWATEPAGKAICVGDIEKNQRM